MLSTVGINMCTFLGIMKLKKSIASTSDTTGASGIRGTKQI